ncbi:hypothetical protein V2J09_000471 [Rumex salicifolius]
MSKTIFSQHNSISFYVRRAQEFRCGHPIFTDRHRSRNDETSPFLALTFMFGDICKAFFQGIIFAFVTHPFDIGDRCVIDGVEVEIKRISILTTSCSKIGTREKMLYPNSMFATELITNLEGKPDPTDVIELVLHSSTGKSQLQIIET